MRGQSSSGKVHQIGGGMMTQRMSNESNSSKNKNKSRNNDNDNDKNNNQQQHQQRQKSFNALPNIPLLSTLPQLYGLVVKVTRLLVEEKRPLDGLGGIPILDSWT